MASRKVDSHSDGMAKRQVRTDSDGLAESEAAADCGTEPNPEAHKVTRTGSLLRLSIKCPAAQFGMIRISERKTW